MSRFEVWNIDGETVATFDSSELALADAKARAEAGWDDTYDKFIAVDTQTNKELGRFSPGYNEPRDAYEGDYPC